jgi:hypothetical protein
MTAIKSGPHTYKNSTSKSSIKKEVPTLSMVLDTCGHETFGWPQLYEIDPNFTRTYQMLGENEIVDNFHIQDGLLCRLVHICVPSSERVKMIWESDYSQVAGHFNI